jgi:TetR/AcrR family transcriptional regulator
VNKIVSVREENKKLILQAAAEIFAHQGFAGTTTAAVAARAKLPKANLHYYFPTKTALYRAVIEPVLAAWLKAASSFDESNEPEVALTRYIAAQMDLAREMPFGSRIWAGEIMRGAPSIQDFLENSLADWVESRSQVVKRWIAEEKLRPIEPKYLFFMIWATTQHYANAEHEITTLEKGRPLDGAEFEAAKTQLIETVLGGLIAK